MGKKDKNKYTCQDYSKEMRLLGLRKKLQNDTITNEEKKQLELEIKKLEKEMGLE